jgi:predicted RNA polymerase sigma factor
VSLINGTVGKRPVGEYQLQAAIAAVHDQAPQADATDWPQILALYGLLERMTGNPVVTLNRAVAAAMAQGPAAGLALLDSVDERLNGHYRLDAVRAHLLEMAGDTKAALEHYRAAADRATNLPEQRYLATQAARLKLEASSGEVLALSALFVLVVEARCHLADLGRRAGHAAAGLYSARAGNGRRRTRRRRNSQVT